MQTVDEKQSENAAICKWISRLQILLYYISSFVDRQNFLVFWYKQKHDAFQIIQRRRRRKMLVYFTTKYTI